MTNAITILLLALAILSTGAAVVDARLLAPQGTNEKQVDNNNEKQADKDDNDNNTSNGFAMTFSSDPQYVWYDEVNPPNLVSDDEIKGNSARQIRQQYADMNKLSDDRWKQGQSAVLGAIMTGDLTAAGHPDQIEFMSDALQSLKMNFYPSLGSRDYADNVDSFADNNYGANHMVKWMYQWLGLNQDILKLNSFDMFHRSYYLFPDFRTDLYGSASYSFTIDGAAGATTGAVHFVQLQNYPTYVNHWNGWDDSKHAYRDFVFIKSSMSWLENDLALARNRGDSIVVCLHDFVEHFTGAAKATFNSMMQTYNVSAIFGGHVHDKIGMDPNVTVTSPVPFFFSGSSTYQQYLVADFNLKTNVLAVQGRRDSYLIGDYKDMADQVWKIPLNNYLPSTPLPVPPVRGHVTFYCDGGFVAVGELSYTLANSGEIESKTTHNLALGNMQVFDIPGDATNISIKGSYVLFGYHKIFHETVDSPPNNCYRMFGTAIKRHWDNSCGRNAGVFEGQTTTDADTPPVAAAPILEEGIATAVTA